MEVKIPTYDVGVIVGRFQVPELHRAHKDLIESVLARHDKVLIVLGKAPLVSTRQNPLDFEARKQMILEQYPTLMVLYNKDQASDEVWSRNLDVVIGDVVMPNQTVVLYGSRDSFIGHYSGRFATHELLQEKYVSGTEIRREIARSCTVSSADFRRGVVWAALTCYETCYATVDVAVFDETEERVLLARKPNEGWLRLIGGFSDPRSPSYEADARREVEEEAGISITDPVYVGSFLIDDWRYRGEVDVIKTLLFRAKLLSGSPQPDDDLAEGELEWFHLASLHIDRDIVAEHRQMLKHLQDKIVGSSVPTYQI